MKMKVDYEVGFTDLEMKNYEQAKKVAELEKELIKAVASVCKLFPDNLKVNNDTITGIFKDETNTIEVDYYLEYNELKVSDPVNNIYYFFNSNNVPVWLRNFFNVIRERLELNNKETSLLSLINSLPE